MYRHAVGRSKAASVGQAGAKMLLVRPKRINSRGCVLASITHALEGECVSGIRQRGKHAISDAPNFQQNTIRLWDETRSAVYERSDGCWKRKEKFAVRGKVLPEVAMADGNLRRSHATGRIGPTSPHTLGIYAQHTHLRVATSSFLFR